MHISHRSRVIACRIALVAYWTALFLATHLPVPDAIAREISALDKPIHAAAYFVMGFLLVLWNGWPIKLTGRRAGITLAIVAGYGALDEWLQTLTGRHGDWRDWVADVIGGSCAVSLGWVLRERREGRRLPEDTL